MNDRGDEDIIPRDDEESENEGADADQDRDVPQVPEDDPFGVPSEFVERISAAWFSGPLPPPEVLQGYKEAEPTAPKIILTMAEKEQGQRHHTERSFMRQVSSGIRYGALLFLALLALAGYALFNGEVTAAVVVALVEFAGLLAIYFRRLPHRRSHSDSESGQQTAPS